MTTYIFLIQMYPVKTIGEHKAGAGFLTNYQPKSGANHIYYKNATQSRQLAFCANSHTSYLGPKIMKSRIVSII